MIEYAAAIALAAALLAGLALARRQAGLAAPIETPPGDRAPDNPAGDWAARAASSQSIETPIPGIFIAGDCGGMGSLGDALDSGRRAVERISKLEGLGHADEPDLLIVGAGPAGITASLAAMERGLSYVTIEQDSFGGTMLNFGCGRENSVGPVRMPLVGEVTLDGTSGEELLRFWQRVERKTGVEIHYRERLDSIDPQGARFEVRTTRGSYRPRAILLANGRLGVPGEELDKVHHRLPDSARFPGQHVLVVGDGVDAARAVERLVEQPGTTVWLSCRCGSLSGIPRETRKRFETWVAESRLQILTRSIVRSIEPRRVQLNHAGQMVQVRNDAVVVCVGPLLPIEYQREAPALVEVHFDTA